MSINYNYYVNGIWKESSTKDTIDIISPYNHQLVGRIQAISQDEVDEIIHYSKIAQKQWKELTVRQRASYLTKWIEELSKIKEELADLIMHEVGKGYNDAMKEVERTIDFIQYTIEEAMHLYDKSMTGENFPGGNRDKIVIHLRRISVFTVCKDTKWSQPGQIGPQVFTGSEDGEKRERTNFRGQCPSCRSLP